MLALVALSIAPFVVGIYRYAMLGEAGSGGSPEDVFLRDRFLQVACILWLSCVRGGRVSWLKPTGGVGEGALMGAVQSMAGQKMHRRASGLVLCLALAAATLIGTPAVAAETTLRTPVKIMPMGDSITHGAGATGLPRRAEGSAGSGRSQLRPRRFAIVQVRLRDRGSAAPGSQRLPDRPNPPTSPATRS